MSNVVYGPTLSYTDTVSDFFEQLDTLEVVYRERDWNVDEWRAEIDHHLGLIDTLLPDYAATSKGEHAEAAERERDLLPDYRQETDPELLRDIALRVASLFYALEDALNDARPAH